jgi:hypothetical protein
MENKSGKACQRDREGGKLGITSRTVKKIAMQVSISLKLQKTFMTFFLKETLNVTVY